MCASTLRTADKVLQKNKTIKNFDTTSLVGTPSTHTLKNNTKIKYNYDIVCNKDEGVFHISKQKFC